MIGQPPAGWAKAVSLLGNGRTLSENSKAVWARQGSAKKAAKAVGEKHLLFSLPSAIFPGSFPKPTAPHECLFYPKFHCKLSYI